MSAETTPGFLAALAARTGAPPPSEDEVEAVLDLARVVAHGVERRLAPVTTYAAGLLLAATPDPAVRARRLRALIDEVQVLAAGPGDAD